MRTPTIIATALVWCLASFAAWAQANTGFAGHTMDGRRYALDERAGRVVMVVLWRTDCAVCLSKMPELRANALGWRHKAFDLVLISLDPRREDAASYEDARRRTGTAKGPEWSLWHGDGRLPAEWRGSRLPAMLLFDTQGQLVKRHEGRLPPEAWDDVAELLP